MREGAGQESLEGMVVTAAPASCPVGVNHVGIGPPGYCVSRSGRRCIPETAAAHSMIFGTDIGEGGRQSGIQLALHAQVPLNGVGILQLRIHVPVLVLERSGRWDGGQAGQILRRNTRIRICRCRCVEVAVLQLASGRPVCRNATVVLFDTGIFVESNAESGADSHGGSEAISNTESRPQVQGSVGKHPVIGVRTTCSGREPSGVGMQGAVPSFAQDPMACKT